MAKRTSPWDMACNILRAHVRPGESCEQAINRLWTKGVSELRPWISRGAVDIYFEHWDPGRLSALDGKGEATAGKPPEAGDPPVVVRWRGRDHRIDGRRRIDDQHTQRGSGPREVLILDIGNVAGDI